MQAERVTGDSRRSQLSCCGRRFELLHADSLTPLLRQGAADLIYAALPAYYDIFARASVPVRDVIGASLGVSGTTLASVRIAADVETGSAVGAVAGLPEDELARAQIADLQRLIKGAERTAATKAQEKLRAYSGTVPAVSGDGYYLARIAVVRDWRGTGLGDRLLEEFQRQGGGHTALSLHVHQNNNRAISFYRRHGYEVTSSGRAEFLYMRRPLLAASDG